MRLEIRNLPEVQGMLGDLASTQLPYALSLSINKTMFALLDESKKRIQTVFDRPTPGIVKSTNVQKTTKTNFDGRIFLSEWRTTVLRVHESGLRREQTGFERKLRLPEDWFAVPTKNMPLNQYGNPTTKTKQEIARARAFGNRGRREYLFIEPAESGFSVLSGRLSPGIYKTQRGSMELTKLYHFIKKIEYRPILKWEETMKEKAAQIVPEKMRESVEIAIRTARR